MNLFNIIKNLIKGGKQAKAANDSGDMLVASCDFLGQTRNVKQITPYGVYGSPVTGSNWLLFSSRANSDSLFGVANDYKNRPKNLSEGEIVLQNLLTGAYVKINAAGNIEIITDGDIIATAANVAVTADTATIDVTTATVNATTANVTATDINLTGAVKITGSLEVNSVIFGTHRHAPSVVPPTNP